MDTNEENTYIIGRNRPKIQNENTGFAWKMISLHKNL